MIKGSGSSAASENCNYQELSPNLDNGSSAASENCNYQELSPNLDNGRNFSRVPQEPMNSEPSSASLTPSSSSMTFKGQYNNWKSAVAGSQADFTGLEDYWCCGDDRQTHSLAGNRREWILWMGYYQQERIGAGGRSPSAKEGSRAGAAGSTALGTQSDSPLQPCPI
ncbi:hypothetical protein UY3_06789 [Chelonia mydas]|uniref:Uncharacterized protein n=1 Tax=Chelonia mydas TaxID=8469 RepID=M7BVE5_CHEMY|nr:hypothetical protein UY3_06789 [Chelonia mydas]